MGETISQKVSLGNRGKKDILFQIGSTKTYKCDIVIRPNVGVVKSGCELEVIVELTIHCTTVLDTDVLIFICKGSESSMTKQVICQFSVR